MAEELHVFDPKGDVLLILRRRSVERMVEYVEEYKSEERSSSRASDVALEVDPLPEEPTSMQGEYAQGPEPEPPEPTEPEPGETGGESDIENDPAKPESSASSASSVSSASWRSKRGVREVQMRVSSKHLILASPTFCTSLDSGTFPEGRMLQTEGSVAVELPDENPDVMAILMNVVHGQTRKVPRHVSLEILTKLAVTVNHRQMQEVVELFSDTWIKNLKPNAITDSSTQELLSWLFIFWVFQKEDNFSRISQTLERESDDNLEDEADAGPPIPASIISECAIERPC
jgi:hypothetical protein